MDCSIVPLKNIRNAYMISTIDFFYPLVEDPYVQGQIGCANVLSDMYSMGIDQVDNMLMVLGASKDMQENDRWIVTQEMMRGFNDLAQAAGTFVTGGQSVINPWPIIGGVAMSALMKDSFIDPVNLVAGDVLVLTKPLGTQVAVNLKQCYGTKKDDHPLYSKVKDTLTDAQVLQAYGTAVCSMKHLNRTGAKLMKKYKAHAATDITGFGILGHAQNLALAQKSMVDIEINTLPIIRHMADVDRMTKMFGLLEGSSAETSGGLLVGLPSKEAAEGFIADLIKEDHTQAWVVGKVVHAENPTNRAYLKDDLTVVDVDLFYV
eukprot:Sspe_Gene.89261::Locus_61062_Transcript_6_10_Confidence_0.208_Length_2237::g.89261::m.89261/K01008/selD, SEPHS; selenide, water dikinase